MIFYRGKNSKSRNNNNESKSKHAFVLFVDIFGRNQRYKHQDSGPNRPAPMKIGIKKFESKLYRGKEFRVTQFMKEGHSVF